MTPATNPSTDRLASNSPTPSQTPSPESLALASLAILLPGALVALWSLPLPVRGASAIIGGLAVLLCGPYLFSHALVGWTRRAAINPS